MKRGKIFSYVLFILLLGIRVCYGEELSKYFLPSWNNENAYRPYPILFVHGIAGHSNMWGGPYDKGSIVELKKYFEQYYEYSETKPNSTDYPEVELSKDKPNEPTKKFKTYWRTYLETIEFSDNNMHPVDEAKELARRIMPLNPNTGGQWPIEWSSPNDVNQQDFTSVLSEYFGANLSDWNKPENKIILICHSMGGLTSRDYISHLSRKENFAHHIAKLITVDTPHYGSYLGGIILLAQNRLDSGKNFYVDRVINTENAHLYELLAQAGGYPADTLLEPTLELSWALAAKIITFASNNKVKMNSLKLGLRAVDPGYYGQVNGETDPRYPDYRSKYCRGDKRSYTHTLALIDEEKRPLRLQEKTAYYGIYSIYDREEEGGGIGWLFNKLHNAAVGGDRNLDDFEEEVDGDRIVSRESQKFERRSNSAEYHYYSYKDRTNIWAEKVNGQIEPATIAQVPGSAGHTDGVLADKASYDSWETILQALDDRLESQLVTPEQAATATNPLSLTEKQVTVEVKYYDYLPANVSLTVLVDGQEQTNFLLSDELKSHPIDIRETTITDNGKYSSGFSFTLRSLTAGVRKIEVVLTNVAGKSSYQELYVNVPDVTIAQLKYEDA